MTTKHQEILAEALRNACGDKIVNLLVHFNEVTVLVKSSDIREVCQIFRDHPALKFDTLIDLCGIDYSTYGDELLLKYCLRNKRFAVIYHLLSVEKNQRLRVRALMEDDELPMIDSVTDIWPVTNWFEREAFDLYGIVFSGHPDLRRILTDYGFIGNPFRKDFPISGYVEMRYDDEQKRVVYQPVTIDPREITPLVIREEHYGDCES